ncbi:GumC family protein [Leptothoe spongobia]|uniref:non-specific protein-tyrosine kinase n=1 Tax=Leptothoe spongobia TAU-MAC 1115 TaxID=1967444 RepID=A0A947GJT5_9CYAN|nr:polysaccharide biosynthesis tyrosine autokinase [Leptothoe spongobia]MBT9317275.1 polysaccharide biosynthesis tyrosine autokinase [Leptothoe spongobia TAU-MAC 1115]
MTAKHLPPVGIPLDEQDREGGLRLDHLLATLKRHFLVITGVTVLTASLAVVKAVTDDPVYRAEFELLTPSSTPESKVISNLTSEILGSVTNPVDTAAVDETTLKILESPRVMKPVLEKLQQRYPDISYKTLISNLGIVPNAGGDVLTVSYQNTDSEKVIYVLDLVLDAYLRYSLEDRQNDISRGISFVDEQLPVAREQVQELEARLESLRQSYNLIDPLLQGEQLTMQASRFSSQRFDLQVEIEEAQSIYQDLQQELARGEELASTSALLENERYQSLLNRLTEIDSQLAEELSLYLDDSPEVAVIKDHRANLEPLIEQEGARVQDQIASQIRELSDRDRALSDTIDALNQQIKGLSTVARQYNDIQRELDIATANLNQFLTKREALRIDAAQRQTPWELLTPVDNPKASSASAKRNLLLGTVLGLLLGVGVAIAWERIKGTINTIEELKDITQLPLLATIPHNRLLANGQPLALAMTQLGELGVNMDLPFNGHSKSTPFLEAFKRLSTNLRLNNPDTPLKSLAISSATPNSGKSTISFHLAHTNASMGQKTLLVDMDLRRPTLHRFCNTSNDKGLSNYITGELELDDILIGPPVSENFYIISSGPIPPDPMQILSAKRMKDFLQQIYEEFDMVIFDTPPLLGFVDAFVAAGYTQGLLLTVRLSETKFSHLNSAMEELSIAKVPVIGMVANDLRQESENSYSYYQYYQQTPESMDQELKYVDSPSDYGDTLPRHSTLSRPLKTLSKFWGKK